MQGNPFYIDPMGGYGESIVKGLSGLGSVIGKRREEERLAEQERQIQAEAQGIFASNDPSKIAAFSLKNPKYAEQVVQAAKFKNDATKQNMSQSMQRILAGEDPEKVIAERAQMVQQQGGDPTETLAELDVWRQNPEAYKQQVATSYALMDPQGYMAFRKATEPADGEKLTGEAANIALARFGTADVSRLTPEQRAEVIAERQKSGTGQQLPAKVLEWQEYQRLKMEDPTAAAQFGQAAGFIDKAGKISPFVEKQLSAATNAVFEAETNIAQYNQLAADLEEANFGGGLAGGSWKEKLKDLTGMQDIATELRRKFNAIKSSAVVKNLPPGAASDADIAFALSGFPTDNYNAKQLASFVRGMAKIEEINAKFNELKANYITENKSEAGLLKAWKQSQGADSSTPGKPAGQSKPSAGNYSQSDITQAAKRLGISEQQLRKNMGL